MVDMHLTVSKALSVKQKCAVCIHDACYAVLLAIAFLCIFARPAYAYVDPSVMTYTIQALAAVAVALSAVLGVAFRRSRKVLFRIFHIDENATKIVEESVHRVDAKGVEAANIHMGEILTDEQIRMRNYKEGRLGFRGRFFTALLVCAFSVYTVFVVAPLELVANNAKDISFSLTDVFGPVMIAGLIMTLVAAVFLSVLRGRVFNVASALVFGLGFCAYVQALFMNKDMPLADGHEVYWGDFTRQMIVSGFVWIVILGAITAFSIIWVRKTRTIFSAAAIVLIVIQTVGVVSLWGPAIQNFTDTTAAETAGIRATREGLYNVSSKKNVVVFVLDTTDTLEVEHLRETNPETFDGLTGFTWYSDTVGSMIPTRYGATSLLYGLRPTDTNRPIEDFIQNWAKDSTFLDDIRSLGYSSGIYSDMVEYDWSAAYTRDRTLNVHELRGRGADNQMDTLGALRILYKAAFCRDLPWVFKPRFWYYSEDLNMRMRKNVNMDDIDLSSQPYKEDDLKYYHELKHYGLTTQEEVHGENGDFRFIHLVGSHPPFIINKNVEPAKNESEQTEDEQTIASFKIVEEYIKELKRLGLYENTSIIITADHGRWYLTSEDIKTPSAPCIFYKPAGQTTEEASAPMKVSSAPVWHYDILAQVLKDMGADKQMLSNYTTPLDEVKEGEERPRYYIETLSNGKQDTELREFVINGDAKDMSNWSLTGKVWPIQEW